MFKWDISFQYVWSGPVLVKTIILRNRTNIVYDLHYNEAVIRNSHIHLYCVTYSLNQLFQISLHCMQLIGLFLFTRITPYQSRHIELENVMWAIIVIFANCGQSLIYVSNLYVIKSITSIYVNCTTTAVRPHWLPSVSPPSVPGPVELTMRPRPQDYRECYWNQMGQWIASPSDNYFHCVEPGSS